MSSQVDAPHGLSVSASHTRLAPMDSFRKHCWLPYCLVLFSPILGSALCPGEETEEGGEWLSLFNGETLAGWTDQSGGEPRGWQVKSGLLHRFKKGGNLHTTRMFRNFELEFEWKVAKGVNSGVKYRFHDGVGPEYQVIDDANAGEKAKPIGLTASLYVIKEPEGKQLNPHGEWNRGKIVARGNRLEHWLNGVKVMEIEVGSEEWKQRKAASKFKDRKGFGTFEGPIHLQDHGGEVWYRNLRIRSLD